MSSLELNPLPAEPKISVITVSFNDGEFIENNIQSILKQNYKNFEHIIVDGGSTDSTQEVVKKYPHVKFISESDRGQSHALNKGFKKASGDIIAWLNSDDHYKPNIFQEVIEKLRIAPIVLGNCQIVDANGNETQYVKNIARSWFDLLKYWIPHSSPAQPAVLFRKELLDIAVERNMQYVDESLHFAMDLDLWLRVATFASFTERLDKTLAVYPIYDECKTGGDWEPIYEEMSRVFKRHERKHLPTEKEISFIMPLTQNTSPGELDKTLRSLSEQTIQNYEIVLIKTTPTSLREGVEETIKSYQSHIKSLRYVKRTVGLTLQQLILQHAKSLYYVITPPGSLFEKNVSEIIYNTYQHDQLSLLFTHGVSNPETINELNTSRLDVDIISQKVLPEITFCIRRAAFSELQLKYFDSINQTSLKELAIKLLWKGWQVHESQELNKLIQSDGFITKEAANEDQQTAILKVIKDCIELQKDDYFYDMRLQHHMTFHIPEELRQQLESIHV